MSDTMSELRKQFHIAGCLPDPENPENPENPEIREPNPENPKNPEKAHFFLGKTLKNTIFQSPQKIMLE